MAGRPPAAKVGRAMSDGGRPVLPGIGSHVRTLSPRATSADLWASVESLTTQGEGLKRLARLHDLTLDPQSQRRLSAYVAQARQYYDALPSLEPVAKPLMGYYFALNVVKAYLTAVDPSSTDGKMQHGASDPFVASPRYSFEREQVRIQSDGIIRDLAATTGMGHWPKARSELRLTHLLPYLVEGVDLYADASGKRPKLLSIRSMAVKESVTRARSEAWITVDIARSRLREAGINPTAMATHAARFGSRFRLVHDSEDPETVTFESTQPIQFTRRAKALPPLRTEFDQSILLRNRAIQSGRTYIVLSKRQELMSSEALTFLVLHHLSNIVRYRPQHAEALRGTSHFWLFSSWVDRACENLLLSVASRLSLEEHVIG